jgi:hypothetical protein
VWIATLSLVGELVQKTAAPARITGPASVVISTPWSVSLSLTCAVFA